MSAITSESIDVDGSDADLVRIKHVSMRAAGVDMGGAMVFSRTALPQIIDALEKQAQYPRMPDQDFVVGPDDISVFGGGHDAAPTVNFTVRRNKDLPGGGLYNLILSEYMARELAAKLRAI